MPLAQELGFTTDQMQAIKSQAFDLLEARELDGAVVIFNGLLVLNPFDAGVYAVVGSIFHQQDKLSEAQAAYDTALSLDGDTVLARVNRGELRCKRGDNGGLDDLKIAARIPSAIQERARAVLRRYSR